MTPNMQATFAWLREQGAMCRKHNCFVCQPFTLRERTEMSRAFDRGNYGNAYESSDLEYFDLDKMSEHERAAFVLGFFGSYSLDEIGSDREIFDECYWSRAGQYVVKVARYTDDRADEYAADEEAFNA